jgi:hypothetical protein
MNVLRSVLVAGALVAISTVSSAAWAQAPAPATAKIPETAADHLALAKSYQEKAAAYKKEAADHRAMAEAYKKSVPPGPKGGSENPWAKKMEDHCHAIAADADKMAADATKAAEYHTLRAKELHGK